MVDFLGGVLALARGDVGEGGGGAIFHDKSKKY